MTFANNVASSMDGGAMYCRKCSNISFDENTTVKFCNNRADFRGGTVYIRDYSSVRIHENSTFEFPCNEVLQ